MRSFEAGWKSFIWNAPEQKWWWKRKTSMLFQKAIAWQGRSASSLKFHFLPRCTVSKRTDKEKHEISHAWEKQECQAAERAAELSTESRGQRKCRQRGARFPRLCTNYEDGGGKKNEARANYTASQANEHISLTKPQRRHQLQEPTEK